MNRREKRVYSIDKLKLCYKQDSDTFTELVRAYNLNGDNINKTITRENYTLHLIDHSCNDEEVTAITFSICFIIDNHSHKLGVFEMKKAARYCFFNFENRALYTTANDSHKNCVNIIEHIVEDMELIFNNITTLEIAMDTNRNYIDRVRRYIRDYQRYDLFINGKLIKDETATIPNYLKAYSSSRRKMSRQPTLYFRHREQDGIQLKIYNKRKEMTESEPVKLNYIPQWGGFETSEPIYRVEITVKNRDIKEYFTAIGLKAEEAMNFITSPKLLENMWLYEADRLIYFRDKATGTIIRLADI